MNEASQCVVLSTGAKPYDIVLLYGARKVRPSSWTSVGQAGLARLGSTLGPIQLTPHTGFR